MKPTPHTAASPATLWLRVVGALLLILSLSAHAAEDRALFWKAERGDATLWLLGSLHLAGPDLYPLRTEIIEGFVAADALAVELDLLSVDAAQMQLAILQRGVYPGLETLQNHLSPQTWQRLLAYLQAEALAAPLFVKQKPGLLMASLTTLKLMRLGFRPEHGLDLHFLRLAQGRKPVVPLESMEEQIDALLDMPAAELVVSQTLDELAGVETLMTDIIGAWKAGREKELARLLYIDMLADNPAYDAVYQRLLVDRNHTMVRKLEELLNDGRNYFVVVGAAHLIGPENMRELLYQRGFSIERR